MMVELAQAATDGSTYLIDRLLQPGNLAASTLLVLVVAAFIKGWIVPGWLYKEQKERGDRMEERAMRATDISREAVTTAERVAGALISSQESGKHNEPRA